MVTLIIPVYNVEKYLDQCLNSVFNQTCKDIEVIIVNDGSKDNSLNIINKYRKVYSDMIYLEQENKGAADARNLAFKYAKGEYILFVDADDYLEPYSVELLYNKAKVHNSDIVIGSYTKIYDDTVKGKNTIIGLDLEGERYYDRAEVLDMMLNLKVQGFSCNKLLKRELCKKINLCYESKRYIEDWYQILKLVLNADKISFVNKSIYNYRQRGNSAIHSKDEKLVVDYNYAVLKIIDYIENCGILFREESMKRFKYETFNIIISGYCRLYYDKGFKMYLDFQNSEFDKYDIKLTDVLFLRNLNLKTRITLFLWKLKILHVSKKIKYRFESIKI